MPKYPCKISQTKGLTLSTFLLITGASLIGFQPSASATETITLTYDADRVDITVPEIKQFANSGELSPKLQAFFDTTESVPTQWSTILTDTIQIPSFIESFLESAQGRHVLHQFDQFIHDSGSQTLVNLDQAVAIAMSDGSISIIEIIQDYPEDSVTINLNEVETVYNEVNALMQGIEEGHWEAPAQELIQTLFCHCQSNGNGESVMSVNNFDPQSNHSQAVAIACSMADLTALSVEEASIQH